MSSVVVLAGAFALAAPAGAASSCERPEPKVTYSEDRFVIALRVDLSGCRWWKGRSIDLEGTLQRTVTGEAIAAFVSCGALVAVATGEPKGKPPRTTKCTLRLRFDHFVMDADRYSGSFTYPWKDGAEEVEFSYICVSVPTHPQCNAE